MRFTGKRVAVVMGGLSAEREVSLNTGAGVLAALRDKQWDTVEIDWREGTSLARLIEDADAHVVWNALHGTWGEDGAVQGLCACLRVPCTGSVILASAHAKDKDVSKRIIESTNVPTPRWQLLAHEGPADAADAVAALADRPLPFVVKPAYEGSSVGVSIVEERAQIAAAALAARRYHGPVIIEDYIAGTEVFVGILDGRVLGSVEVRPTTKFYDYEAKYKRTDTKYLLPPELPRDVIDHAEHHALAAYDAHGCSGHARPDPPDLRARRTVRARGQHVARHDEDEPVAEDRARRRDRLRDAVRADPRVGEVSDMGLPELLHQIELLGGKAARPVVSLELFFDGNEDVGSIGCNLSPHPGIPTFERVLRSIRARPEVSAVVVEINQIDDSWPFAHLVYIITTATDDEVHDWAAALRPDPWHPAQYPGWCGRTPPPPGAPDVPPGQRVVYLFWD